MILFLTLVTFAAFALSVVAVGLAIRATRDTAAVSSAFHRHRRAHGEWSGEERRRLNLGAPRHTGERRRRPESRQEPPEQLTVDEAPTGEQEMAGRPLVPETAQIQRVRLPRPGEHGQGKPPIRYGEPVEDGGDRW